MTGSDTEHGSSLGVTGNAAILLGYLAGSLYGRAPYSVVAADGQLGTIILEHEVTANTFRVSVEQLEGIE